MQRQSNQEQQPWLFALDNFNNFIGQIAQFLEKFHNKALRRLGFYRYPLDGYIKAWKSFSQIINRRVKAYHNNRQIQVLISTALNWVMPLWTAAYNDIFLFVKRYCTGEECQEPSLDDLKQVYQEFKIAQRFSISEINTVHVLELPFIFMEQLMQSAVELTSSLQQRQRLCEKDGGEYCSDILFKKIIFLKIQSKQMQLSLMQLSKLIEFLKKSDEGNKALNRDNSVIRYNLLLKQYQPVEKHKRRFIMRYIYRIKLISKWRRLDKKRQERLKQRKMNILQLIDGEDKYIKGLDQYIENVKEPIQALKSLDQSQIRKLFSSIIEIRSFHQSMLIALKTSFDNYKDQQEYAPILKKFIPFFKLYTDYILNAESAQKHLQDLIKTNKDISEICKRYTANTSKMAQNQLLQPTFRIARYQMLFQQIVKKTSNSHRDYSQLIEVQAIFKKILTQVNDEVDKILRRNRLNQLQSEYGTKQFPIFAENRQFNCQYSLALIKQPKPEPVILIIFNNLVLIVEQTTKKLIKRIQVNDQFFAKREQDNKIFRNMVTIHSDGFITFTAGSDDVNANRAEEVYQQLRKITKDSGQLVYVNVLGTEEIGSTSFSKYTEFIVEVKFLDLKKLLHVRFSQISFMVSDMQRQYKDSLKITQDDSLRKNWFNSHKSKIIEARKLVIGQIFQKLFNHELIKKNPSYFLKYLNLPENFYHIARTSYQKRISIGQSVAISGLRLNYLTKKEERQAFTILCGTEIKLGRDLFHDNENDEQLKKKKDAADKIEIKVITLFQEEPIEVRITDYDTVQDICNKVSKLIGLRSNRDFRLFHQIGKKELRVLEHQQLMTKIFQFPRNQQDQPVAGFFDMVRASIIKVVLPENYPTLIFKKYYYLPYDIQQAQVRKDLTRLRLMVFQVFSQIRDMKYQLTFDEYLLFLAMLLYIKAEGILKNAKNSSPSLVHKVIPDTVFKLKNYTQIEWLQKCQHHLERIDEQILKVIDYNREQYKNNKIKADTVSKQNLYFGHKHLCSQIVLNKIKTNHIFGSNIFYVQPHNNCYKKLEDKKLKVAYNMWLAVKVQSVNLLTPSSKQSILQLKYTDIGKIEVFSQSIVFKTSGAIEQEYRLNTYQSFEISQLVKYNQSLNEILKNLKQDGELNSRVKLYRDQLIQYRTTYEQDNGLISLIR